ncbi:SHC-transforming protein 1-like isoform X1 [Lampetra fluviatilis]
MLHRPKYSRFRNDSVTSADERTSGGAARDGPAPLAACPEMDGGGGGGSAGPGPLPGHGAAPAIVAAPASFPDCSPPPIAVHAGGADKGFDDPDDDDEEEDSESFKDNGDYLTQCSDTDEDGVEAAGAGGGGAAGQLCGLLPRVKLPGPAALSEAAAGGRGGAPAGASPGGGGEVGASAGPRGNDDGATRPTDADPPPSDMDLRAALASRETEAAAVAATTTALGGRPGPYGADPGPAAGTAASKAAAGWPHPVERITGAGVSYLVKYLGCMEVLQSMRALPFSTRTQLTREVIARVSEACPSTKPGLKKRKPVDKAVEEALGPTNQSFSGRSITLTISLGNVSLTTVDGKQIIATHHMQSISFASGGDMDMADYVAYVAKDPVNQRACHVLECGEGIAQQVIGTIGQAFELRFRQFLQSPGPMRTGHDRGSEDERDPRCNYYNSVLGKEPPAGGLLDARLQLSVVHTEGLPLLEIPVSCSPGRRKGVGLVSWDRPTIPEPPAAEPGGRCYVNTRLGGGAAAGDAAQRRPLAATAASPRDAFDMRPFHDALAPPQGVPASGGGVDAALRAETWYHGPIARKDAETLVRRDGEFLVRASTSSRGQFVLTGSQGGLARHVLLVDPTGVVRTKDHRFDSVSHLIRYHRDFRLPIISAGSELCLVWPVERRQPLP